MLQEPRFALYVVVIYSRFPSSLQILILWSATNHKNCKSKVPCTIFMPYSTSNNDFTGLEIMHD